MEPRRHRGPIGAARWRGVAAVGLGTIAGLAMAAGPFGTGTSGATSAPWAVLPSPNAAGAYYSSLQSVSCPTATECVAVGSSAAPTGPTPAVGQQVPLAEIGHGSAWVVSSVPQAPGTSPFSLLASVSCPDATHCVAVGATRTSPNADVPLIETWNGTSWTLVAATGLATGYLTAVSCTSATWCMAVGHAAGGTPTVTPPVSDVWDGTAWTAKAVPVALGETGTLGSVSCVSTVDCVAVGTVTGAGFTNRGLGETWNGAAWTMTGPLAQPPKTPSNLTGVELSGVSCVSTTWCMGVGAYETTGQSVPFSEIWNGTAWALTSSGPGAMTFANAVTCSSVSSCVTVGSHGSQSAADPWTGSAWDYDPLPAFTSPNSLASVSCPSGGPCVGVGSYETNDGANTLVEAAGVTLTSPGYRLVAADGGVFAFTAPFHGSMGGHHLNAPIVGMASDATTGGYWLAASDGGVFAFTAPFHGSMGGKPLNAPVVGMASDAATGGYWLVASDGGVFAFTAPFAGSRATTPGLLAPAVGIATDPTVGGYWIVTARGTVGVGQQARWGTLGGLALAAPVVAVVDDPATGGYWLVAADGGVFALNATYAGSMGGTPLAAPIVGGAAASMPIA